MKKTTFLKVILLAFIFSQSYISYSQSLVSYVSRPEKDLDIDFFRIEKNTLDVKKAAATYEKSSAVDFMAANVNPVIKYAQLPYAGQVSICPNNGKELPKLFLCGGNDSRLIETGITDAQSITWQRFISGGSCVTVSNSDCANESADPACWVQIATGKDYLANTAGQFRVIIVDALGTAFVYYFNVYQNTLIPTAVAKSDIVTYGTGTCKISGVITVGGFGSGYEYSFTTGTAPGTWQDSNVFTTNTAGNYTAFIRIKGVVGSCEFKVINLEIKTTVFEVKTSVTSPKCNGGQGSIQVTTNDVKQQYIYKIYNSSNTLVSSSSATANADYPFPGLNSGTYKVETSVVGATCMVDSKTVTIANAPAAITATAVIKTALAPCSTGVIEIKSVSGGVSPYKYLVSLDNAEFVLNANNLIKISESGNYAIRVEDANGCFIVKNVTIIPVDKPSYDIIKTDGNCTGKKGEIKIDVTDFKGYSVDYNIDNSTNYFSSAHVFSGLNAGNYTVKVRYRKTSSTGSYCYDPSTTITIGASTALTASAGVAALSGCGPAGNEIQGQVRITNAQGGTPPYTYSFDGKQNWSDSNEAFINPIVNHTVFIKDAAGCEYAMGGITLKPKPADPTIKVAAPVFNCDGTATTTVTVTNDVNSEFSYNYFIDGNANIPIDSNVFKNVSQGDHTITVSYSVNTVPTYSNLLNEDFGSGDDTTSPGINTTYYCWERQVAATQCNGSPSINDGDYTVTSNISFPFGSWLNPIDHTTGTTVGNGRYLAVNIGATIPKTAILYQKEIKDIIKNQPISVEIFAVNLLRKGQSGASPDLQLALVDAAGNDISSISTGSIPKSNNWEKYLLTLNPGDNTNLKFVIRSNVQLTDGNDVAVDDIKVFQIPKSCNTVAAFPIVVDGSKAFSASITGYKDVKCNGERNGEITLSARNFDPVKGFQYQVDGGSWITVIPSPAATTGSVTLTNLTSKIYNINIRYENSASSCTFPLAQEIKMPTVVTAAASILTLATCTTGATIRATGDGGTPAYLYELREANGTTIITAFNNNRDFTNVPAGNYTVFVRDANSCTSPVGKPISVVAAPAVTATLGSTTDYCYTTADPATLVVNVSGGTGPFTYQLDSNAGVSSALTPFSFANVGPGTHTILVTDSNNCKSTIPNIFIAPQIGFNVSLINDLTCLVGASIGNEVVTNGNGAPYTYAVSYNTGTPTSVASFPYTATLAGNYVFTVTDSRGCPATSNIIVVTPKTTPTHSPAKTDITCNGLTNGTITVTPSGGFTTTYTYAIKLSTATTYTTQSTNQFTGLAAATYDIKVIDSKGCESLPTQVTIANPTAIAANATATAFSCSPTNAPQSATITVAPTGGTGTYSYSYDNGGTFGSNTTLIVNNNGLTQTIKVVVSDANGCLSPMQAIVLAPLNRPTKLDFSNAAVTCTAPTTTVSVKATNGVGALTFLITGTTSTTNPSFFGPVNTTGSAQSASFPGLLSGNYTFRVTDANGCYYSDSYTIVAVTPIAIAPNKTSDVLCKDGSTGSGTYTISGNATVGAYTFALTAGTLGTGTLTKSGNVLTLSNVVAGTYTVRVKDDATGCFADGSIIINQPAAPLAIDTAVPTNFNCNNDNAQITVTPSGGTTNYSYAFAPSPSTVPTSAYNSNNVVTVDTNGGTIVSWDVYVRDANGCTTVRTVTVSEDPAPAPPVVTVPNQCSATGSGFTLQVTPVTGSLTPYTYGIAGISGPFQSTTTFTVASGNYTVYVKDGNGCVSTGTAVTVAAQLTAIAAVTKTLDCSPTTPNATVTTTISGGGAPFSYTITDSSLTVVDFGSGITGPTINYSAAVAGKYTIKITDANACSTTTSATVAPISNPTVAVTNQVNVSCNGGGDGSVTLTGSGGSGGYEYSDDNVTFVPSGLFTTLTAAGSPYTFYVRDNKGCPGSVSVTITQPANGLAASVTEVPFSCNISNANVSGTVTINVTAGTGTAPYTYSFNGGAFTSNNVLTLNDNGSNQPYTYAVQDAKGCSISDSGTLLRLNTPVIGTITSTPIFCAPAAATTSTVTIPVNAGTGVAPLAYTIVSGPVTNTTGATTGVFSGLTSGNYVFRVTDANKCYDTESHFVAPVVSIAVAATKLTDVACFGDNTGSARFTVTGFSTSGNYTINVTSSPSGLPFALSPTGDVRTLTDLVAGTYTFSVTDNTTGCSDSKPIIINQPTAVVSITSASGTAVFCSNDNSQITINATGGTPSFGYAAVLAGAVAPTTFGTSNVITVDTNSGADLAWDVYVRDANGCVTPVPTTVNITDNGAPTVSASVSNQCVGTGSGFQIVAVGAGGLAPYTYTINTGVAPTGALLNTFTVAAETYTVTVTDANGCPATTSITVNQRLTAVAAVTKDITCAAPQEATIRVNVSGGLAPFEYRVKIGAAVTYTGTPTPFAGTSLIYTPTSLTDTSYEFEITDANSTRCAAITNVVTTTTPVTVSATEGHVDPTCNGFTDGSITLTATAGVPTFTYAIAVSPTVPATFLSNNVFGGLASGSYNYIVRDAKGCDATGTILLDNPAPVVATITVKDITCNAADTPGSIEITNITGGLAPFTFTLLDSANNILHVENTSSTSFSFPNALNFGDYYVTVSDSKGCEFKSAKLRISSVPYLTFLPPSISGDCITGATVNLQIDTTFPTAPNYIYSIFGDPSSAQPATSSTSATFTGLNFGQTYFFKVIDNNNCTSIVEVVIDPLSPIKIDPVTITNVSCNTLPVSTNGAIDFTVFDYSAGVTQLRLEILDQLTNQPLTPAVFKIVSVVSLSSITDSFTGLSSGAYTLKVEEVDGTRCSRFYPFDITQPIQPLKSAVTATLNANCNTGARVTLTTTGGTGPYTYASAVVPAFSTVFSSGNVLTLNPGVAGTDLNWNITVRDANGCTFELPVTIAVDPTPVIDLTIFDKCVAQGAYEIIVTETTAGTGAYSISVDGDTFTSIPGLPYTVSGLNSGSHTIIIRDANGCEGQETIIIDEPLVATPEITALPTCADDDGEITMTGTGGPVAGTYTYTIFPSPISVAINNATGVISGLPAGTYTVTMTDTATPTNCTTTAIVTLSAAITVTFSTATTPTLCVGDSNGSITVTLLSGNTNPSYTYEIIAGPQLAVATSSNIFTGLPTGTYTVRVNSGRGCSTDDTSVFVAPATPLIASASFPANTTCSTTTLITVNATGGTPTGVGTGYTYNFNGLGYTSDNTFTVNNIALATPVNYTVRDANGCETLSQSVRTPALNSPTNLTFSITTAPTCPANTAEVQVTATNGVGALVFEIIEFNNAPTTLYPPQTTAGSGTPASFAVLLPGDYMFQVTDENGCTYQGLYTVVPVTPIAIVGGLINDIACNGVDGTTNDGSARFTVTGFSSTGNYSINVTSVPAALPFTQLPPVGDVITLTGLSAGTYTVTVKDNTTLCEAFDAVNITLPAAIDFTTTATKVFCSQDFSQITVSAVSGGTGVYKYAVLPGGTATPPTVGAYNSNPVLSVDTVNGTLLTWDVYVRDAKGCVAMKNVIVVSDAPPSIVAPAPQCFDGSSIVINLASLVTVPIGPVQYYTVNGSNQISTTYTITAPRIYDFSVTDANGCVSNVVSYTIEDQLIAGAVLVKDVTCAPTQAATIDVTITGGIAPFTVQTLIDGTPSGVPVTGVLGPVYTTNPTTAGLYSFLITDSYTPSCSVTTTIVEVTTPVTPTFTAIATDATCNLDSNGTITVTPTVGVAPFTFALSGTGANTTGDATGNYSGLPAGSYTVVITDAKGCPSAAVPAIVIDEPLVVSATISVTTPLSCGTGNITQAATVTAVPSGGNGSYQYNFNNQGWTLDDFYVTNTFGPVSVIVRDTNGCSFATAVSATVDALDPPTDMDITGTLIYCAPAANTTSTVRINSVTDGVGPFTYQIISPVASIINNGNNNVFSGLSAGDYLFQVTDNNGCTYQELYTVAVRVDIAVAIASSSNSSCFTYNNGSASFNVTNFTSYTATLTAGTGTPVIAADVVTLTSLAPGNYTLQVTDSMTGCTADVSFIITEPTQALDFTTVATNINCTVGTAAITVTASGGTLNYKYAVALATAPAPLASAYSLSNALVVDTNNGADMNWIVYVIDANGCSINKPQTILLDANPSNITVAPYSECPDVVTRKYTFTINPPTGVAPFTYSIGGGFQSSPTFVVNAPGSYDVTVMDANGCPTTELALVVIRDPLILTPVVTIPVSCTGGDGQISVSATGGSGGYEYNIDGGPFAAVIAFNLVTAGNHTIGVLDTATLCEVFVPVNLQAATLITGFALAATDVTCNGGSDGTIRASFDTPEPGINDNPVYLYSLNGGTPQDSNLFSGLAAGSYTVRIISSRGCDKSAIIPVGQPGLITFPVPAVVQFRCTSGNIDNLATITVTGVNGGSGTYLNYEFIKVGTSTNTQVQFSTSNVYNEANLAGGSYIINVYDDKGCVGTNIATINQFIGIDFASPAAVTVTKPITCIDTEDIQVNATFTGGPPVPLDYTIVATVDNPVLGTVANSIPYPTKTNSSGQFTNLTVGSYAITVTNPITGCSIKTIHYVNDPNTFDIVASNIQNVLCYGAATGSVALTFVDNQLVPNNDAGPFDYTIKSATGTTSTPVRTTGAAITIPNLPAGVYTVKAKLVATPSCEVETNFTIDGPITELEIFETHTPITCDPGNDGSISASADGGWPGSYQYELVGLTPGSVSVPLSYQFTFENLTPGTYHVIVHDTGGCSETATVILSDPTPIVITASATAATLACNGDNNGEIVVNPPTGGQGSNYSYILNYVSANPVFSSAPQTTSVFSGLSAGTYSVTVIDGLGCISRPIPDITITDPTKVEATLVLASGITCVDDATVTLSATGGTGPYEYSTDMNFPSGSYSSVTATPFSVGLGDHQYYVRDANGCVSYISNNVTINALTPLSLSTLDFTVIYCKGSATGIIDAAAIGGLANYSYTLFDDGNTIVRPAQPTGYFDLLVAGKYIVRVDSGDCQYNSAIFEIVEPDFPLAQNNVVTNVTCTGEGNGKIEITASGGTGKITYAISPNLNQSFEGSVSGGHVFDNLEPGTYDYIVQDENGCFIYITGVVITQPNSIIVTTIPGTVIPEVCAGDKDGAFIIEVIGGTGPYKVSLDAINGTYTQGAVGQTSFDFTNLIGGTHTVYIQDANNCTSELDVIMPEPVVINPERIVTYDCVNNAQANRVVVTYDASNDSADLDFDLDGLGNWQMSNIFENVAPGTHFIMVRHTNGCTQATPSFTITQVDPLALVIEDGDLNQIKATATDGAGQYEYSFNGEDFTTESTYAFYKSGNYTVIVRDQNGCTVTLSRDFTYIDICISNYFTPNGDGNLDEWAPGCTNNYPNLSFSIFDRYGRVIAKYKTGQKWDGKYKGEELPSGDYWYTLKLNNNKDNREFVGHFTLYR